MDDELSLAPIRQPTRFNTDDFYRRCTLEELHNFLASRQRFQVPRLSRHACLIALTELDKAARFRFLALPRDIRLMIYDEILLFDTEHERSLCPQILATCRKVYEEAQPTLRKNLKTTTVVRINYEEAVGHQMATARDQGPLGVFVPRTCWYDTSSLVTAIPGSVQHGSWSTLSYTKLDGRLKYRAPPEIQNKGHMLVYLRLDADVDHVKANIWQHLDALVGLINAKDSKIRHVDIRTHHMRGQGLNTCQTWLSLLQELPTCLLCNIKITVQGLPKICAGPKCRCRGNIVDTLQKMRLSQYPYQKAGLAWLIAH
ncbi:hypothetical protein HII31_03587 [Pseudocercospora fuligena]|uniref:Uncharacterized protein n=1 Tax=Pseudocercospora fuligena TaxID=685502 RepID=A0A8H6VNX8_9PEZI|nr:hypothetical protein HII31_03587 [Pseudocercospora fuligena]